MYIPVMLGMSHYSHDTSIATKDVTVGLDTVKQLGRGLESRDKVCVYA